MKKYLYFAGFLACLALTPSSSHAFTPTDTAIFRVSNTGAIYAVQYEFGSNRIPVHVPVFGSLRPDDTEFGYRVRRNDEPFTPVATAALALGDAPIRDGMYVVEPGRSVTFTALIFVTVPDEPGSDAYHVEFTKLPMFEGEPRRATPLLNDTQLERFTTGKVAL
jgi:hypothetical protein